MRYSLLILCLTIFGISAQEPPLQHVSLDDTQKAYCTHIAKQITQAPLTFRQGSFLLNMLYNMYLYTKYESLVKKHTYALYTQLITLHDAHQPEEIAAITKLQNGFSQAQCATHQQMCYYHAWQSIERHISEHEPELNSLINHIQDAGQQLVKEYVESTINYVDDSLAHAKEDLESEARNNHTIARVYGLLINEPELFCENKDLRNMQKINVIHGLNKLTQENIEKLLTIKQKFTHYIQALQEVVATLFDTIYLQLYMNIHTQYPDQEIKLLTPSDDGIEESEQVLTYPIVSISNT